MGKRTAAAATMTTIHSNCRPPALWPLRPKRTRVLRTRQQAHTALPTGAACAVLVLVRLGRRTLPHQIDYRTPHKQYRFARFALVVRNVRRRAKHCFYLSAVICSVYWTLDVGSSALSLSPFSAHTSRSLPTSVHPLFDVGKRRAQCTTSDKTNA